MHKHGHMYDVASLCRSGACSRDCWFSPKYICAKAMSVNCRSQPWVGTGAESISTTATAYSIKVV